MLIGLGATSAEVQEALTSWSTFAGLDPGTT
jgi:hypothetical protein